MLQNHYHLLSKMSMDCVFDVNWNDEVDNSVSSYGSLSKEVADAL